MDIENNAGAHNSLFRGKNLGSSVTATQYSQILAGTFDDIFVGDYWVINDNEWRVAALDYWLNFGDQGNGCETHHVVIVPDRVVGANKRMEASSTTVNGYGASEMRTTNLADAKTAIESAFGSAHILSHRDRFVSKADANGWPTSTTWYDATVELMSERMVYGDAVFGRANPILNGTSWTTAQIYQIDFSQLPLFRHDHGKIVAKNAAGTGTNGYWLQDVVSAPHFAVVSTGGLAYSTYANSTYGVRPCFGIVG